MNDILLSPLFFSIVWLSVTYGVYKYAQVRSIRLAIAEPLHRSRERRRPPQRVRDFSWAAGGLIVGMAGALLLMLTLAPFLYGSRTLPPANAQVTSSPNLVLPQQTPGTYPTESLPQFYVPTEIPSAIPMSENSSWLAVQTLTVNGFTVSHVMTATMTPTAIPSVYSQMATPGIESGFANPTAVPGVLPTALGGQTPNPLYAIQPTVIAVPTQSISVYPTFQPPITVMPIPTAIVPPTQVIMPTAVPTSIPQPTAVPPTSVPPTSAPQPTAIPPTVAPPQPTAVPPQPTARPQPTAQPQPTQQKCNNGNGNGNGNCGSPPGHNPTPGNRIGVSGPSHK